MGPSGQGVFLSRHSLPINARNIATSLQHAFKANHTSHTKHAFLYQLQHQRQRSYQCTCFQHHLFHRRKYPPAHRLAPQRQPKKKAEAAARSLRRVQAHLDRYREILDGHAATEDYVVKPLLRRAQRATKRFESISHPGDRARKSYESAKRDYDETVRVLKAGTDELLAERAMARALKAC